MKSHSKKQTLDRHLICSILSLCKMSSSDLQGSVRITRLTALEPAAYYSKCASFSYLIPVLRITEPHINPLLMNEKKVCKQSK